MAACTSRGFENRDGVAALHEFVSAAQPGEPASGDDDALRAGSLATCDRTGEIYEESGNLQGVSTAHRRVL